MSRRKSRGDQYRNNSSRGGGKNAPFYGHDDRGGDEGSSWRGGHSSHSGGSDRHSGGSDRHSGGSDHWRGKSKRGGWNGPSGREDTGGKWQRSRGSRRRGGGMRGGHQQGPGPRSRLNDDDGDVFMGDMEEGPSQRYNPYGRSNNKRGNRNKNRHSQDDSSSGSMSRLGLPLHSRGDRGRGSFREGRHNDRPNKGAGLTWNKITIPYGRKVEKDWLIVSLQNACSIPFIPLEFHYEGDLAIFYVDDMAAASALRNVSKRITAKSGHKIIVLVKPTRPLVIDAESLEALKLCLSDRYDPSTKSLNLSNLANDQGLKSKGVSGILSRNHVMDCVIQIITDNIPEVLSIDFRNNKLSNLSNLSKLASKATDLRTLLLGKNLLRSESDLEAIKGFNLEDLVLEGNPVADKSNYTSIVRRQFPKLVRLDGQELPAHIAFDVESSTVLPVVQHSFFGNDDIKKLLVKFIEQYFTVFDSNDRQPFIEIYHDQACFSMMCQNTSSSSSSLRKHLNQSRNLLRIKETSQAVKLFKYSKLSVVAYLTEMAPTQHDTNSFQVDVSLVQGKIISFTVHGMYREFGSSNRSQSQLLAFSRTFLAIMQPPTLCIVNDHLIIREPTHAQAKVAFVTPAPTPSPSPVTVPQGSLSPARGLTALQQEMVAKFIRDSNMNADWSIKCLAENEWDYEKAGTSFTLLHSQGKIPIEAFVK